MYIHAIKRFETHFIHHLILLYAKIYLKSTGKERRYGKIYRKRRKIFFL